MNQHLERYSHVPEVTDNTVPFIPDQLIQDESSSTAKPFIEANTIVSSLTEIQREHIIPVFIRIMSR
jgi:hypothetical protein